METPEEEVGAALVGMDKMPQHSRKKDVYNLVDKYYNDCLASGLPDDEDTLKKLFKAVDTHLAQARPVVVNPNEPFVLCTVTSRVMDLIGLAMEVSDSASDIIRYETGILPTLTSSLKDKYSDADQVQILTTIEVISRGLKTMWAAPSLFVLVKHVFTLMMSTSPSSDAFQYGLRIVTNLVFTNRCCLNIVVRDSNYKDVMKLLLTVLASRDDSELAALASHLSCLTEVSVSFTPSMLMDHVKRTLLDLQEAMSSESSPRRRTHIARSITYMTNFFSTILERESASYKQDAGSRRTLSQMAEDKRSHTTELVNYMTNEISKRIVPGFLKFPDRLRNQRGQGVVQALLLLVKAAYPRVIPDHVYDDDVVERLIKCIDELGKMANSKSTTYLVLLETYLYFIDRRIEFSSSRMDIFHNALASCQIVVSTTSQDLLRNILTIRLLTRLGTMPPYLVQVRKLLSEEVMSKLLHTLLDIKTTHSSKTESLRLSTCVMETLNVMTILSKSPAVVMDSLQREETLSHISYCIVNGNEALITQALNIAATVGFTGKCRANLSKKLIAMRETSPGRNLATDSSESAVQFSDSARGAMKKLNDNLEMLVDAHEEGKDYALDDVLTWYKLKNDMHETEVANMTDHIFQLNRTIGHLKALLDRQSELVAVRATTTEVMQRQHRDLTTQFEKAKEKKIEMELKHAKAMASLRDQLVYQEGLSKLNTEKLAMLEQQVAESKRACAELEASREEAIQSSRKLSSEKTKVQEKLEEVEKDWKTSKTKISTLEKDLKKSEEARKNAETLLEAERRKTEIIQQVLGNRLT